VLGAGGEARAGRGDEDCQEKEDVFHAVEISAGTDRLVMEAAPLEA
jgi:hypothetical protein